MLKANPQTKKKVSVLGTTEDVWEKKGDNWKCMKKKKVETTESVTEKYIFFLMPKATCKIKKGGGDNWSVLKCVQKKGAGNPGSWKKAKVCSKKGRQLGELKRKEVSVWKGNFFLNGEGNLWTKEKRGREEWKVWWGKKGGGNWKCVRRREEVKVWLKSIFFLMLKATCKLKKKGSVLGTAESVTKRFFF